MDMGNLVCVLEGRVHRNPTLGDRGGVRSPHQLEKETCCGGRARAASRQILSERQACSYLSRVNRSSAQPQGSLPGVPRSSTVPGTFEVALKTKIHLGWGMNCKRSVHIGT